jgi:NADH:ubiquinone oxidoreductase subunit B-like Fe-S oxidoreductase
VDLLLVGGVVNSKMAPVRRLSRRWPSRAFVIACGAGAISGGLFADSQHGPRAAG